MLSVKVLQLLFFRHLMLLREHYGNQVIVNLLRIKGGEEVLSRAYKVWLLSLETSHFVHMMELRVIGR